MSILQVSQIFHVAVCFITIFDRKVAVTLSSYGMNAPEVLSRSRLIGAWTVVPEAKQLLVIEDMLEDVR